MKSSIRATVLFCASLIYSASAAYAESSHASTAKAPPGRAVAAAAPKQIWIPSREDQMKIDAIKRGIEGKIAAVFKKTGKAFRDAHAKQHGCVKAEFTVEPGLEKHGLNHGVFANPGKTYKSWIRFSNGSGDPAQDDLVPGGRGMAIKLFGVKGPKFLDDEKNTQDFQMINHPVFFVKNVSDYVDFQKDPASFFKTHREEAGVSAALGDPKINPPKNPFESTYYSMTARQLGPATKLKPTKFSATPVPCEVGAETPVVKLTQSKNALRQAMKDTLAERDVCFEFGIQSQANEKDMPSDNPVKLWSEKEAPFITVAKIRIKKSINRNFDNTAQELFCEDLSITPWHSIEEHQPLGSIELTRKVVYQATSALRHRLNERPKVEPTGDETFEP